MTHTGISISTGAHNELQDITRKVMDIVHKSGIAEGRCSVFIPHTTCGVTINENADPTVKQDILMELDKRIPWNDNYAHLEGNSAAHVKASLMGFTVSVPVSKGQLLLGTWQGIYLCEFDGPRNRRAVISVE